MIALPIQMLPSLEIYRLLSGFHLEKSQYMTETDLISGKQVKVDSIDIIQTLASPKDKFKSSFLYGILSDFPNWKDLTNFCISQQLNICN